MGRIVPTLELFGLGLPVLSHYVQSAQKNNNDNLIKIQHATLAMKQFMVSQYWVTLIILSTKGVPMNDYWTLNDLIYLGYLGLHYSGAIIPRKVRLRIYIIQETFLNAEKPPC